MNLLQRFIPPFSAIAEAWSGHYPIKGEDCDADCVIGFSFGYRQMSRHISPGLSNEDLADVAKKHYGKFHKIFQFEIADAYKESGARDADKVIRITKHQIPGKYLDTYEVARQAKEIMEKHGLKRAILLAHPYHLPRVEAVCTKMGIDWVADRDEQGTVEFDPKSEQKWTRNLNLWRSYEPLALTFYRLKGWV